MNKPPLRSWPYFLFIQRSLVNAISRRGQPDVTTTESPFMILTSPKLLRETFTELDLAKFYYINTVENHVIPNDGLNHRESFFRTFWGQEWEEDLESYYQVHTSSNVVDQRSLYNPNDITKPHTILEWEISPSAKPTVGNNDQLFSGTVYLIVVEDGEINNLITKTKEELVSHFDIVKQAVKTLHRTYSLNEVPMHPWFNTYIKLLS